EFTEDGLNAKHVKAWDQSQIDTEYALQMAAKIERGVLSGRRLLSRFGWCGGIGMLALEFLNAFLNFSITVGDQLLVVALCRLRLLESKNVLAAVFPDQALANGFDGCFDSVVAQFG